MTTQHQIFTNSQNFLLKSCSQHAEAKQFGEMRRKSITQLNRNSKIWKGFLKTAWNILMKTLQIKINFFAKLELKIRLSPVNSWKFGILYGEKLLSLKNCRHDNLP